MSCGPSEGPQCASCKRFQVDSFAPLQEDIDSRRKWAQTFYTYLRDAFEKVKADPSVEMDTVVFGLTAWFRELPGRDRVQVITTFLDLFAPRVEAIGMEVFGDKKVALEIHQLPGLLEAECECMAIRYACRHNFGFGLDQIDMIVSGGNGSVQLTPSAALGDPVSVPLNMKWGAELVENPREGVALWTSHCDVMLGRVMSVYRRALKNRAAENSATRINCICMSAFYYGALAAGIVKKGEPPKSLKVSDVLAQIREFLKGDKNKARDVANTIRILHLLSGLFPEEIADSADVTFARNWTVQGEEFITTWTSGYFLQRMEVLGEKPATVASKLFQDHVTGDIHDLTPGCCGGEMMSWLRGGHHHRHGLQDAHSPDAISRHCDFALFDDEADVKMHSVPYSQRLHWASLKGASTDCVTSWVQVGVACQALDHPSTAENVGLEFTMRPCAGAADDLVVCISFVSGEHPGPPIALGHTKGQLTSVTCPVTDVGVLFDANVAGGSVFFIEGSESQQQVETVTPWDPCVADTYQVWFEAVGEGQVEIWIARGKRRLKFSPVNTENLKFPCVPSIWVYSEYMTENQIQDPAVTGVRWVSRKSGFCSSLGWGTSYLLNAASDCAKHCRLALTNTFIPISVTEDMNRFHEANPGVRDISCWPRYEYDDPSSSDAARPELIVSGGGTKLLVWNKDGRLVCSVDVNSGILPEKVWSVSVLDGKPAILTAGWDFRILVGTEYPEDEIGASALTQLNIFIPDWELNEDPQDYRCNFKMPGCCKGVALEATVTVDPDSLGLWGSRHTGVVSGIYVDERRKAVYTTSYDKTVSVFDIAGGNGVHVKGWHSDIILSGALTQKGAFFATASADRACIFDAQGPLSELPCIARVEFALEEHIDHCIFSVAFLPRDVWEDQGRPQRILLGCQTGDVLNVPLHWEKDSGTKTGGQVPVMFVPPREDVRLPLGHKDCVRRLLWLTTRERFRGKQAVAVKSSNMPLLGGVEEARSLLEDQRRQSSTGSTDGSPGTEPDAPHAPLWTLVSVANDGMIHLHHNEQEQHLSAASALSALQDSTPQSVEFHQTAIRAGAVDQKGELFTGDAKMLARWQYLQDDHLAHVQLPVRISRDADVFDIYLAIGNTVVVAFQILRYTLGSSVLGRAEAAQPIRITADILAMKEANSTEKEFDDEAKTAMKYAHHVLHIFNEVNEHSVRFFWLRLIWNFLLTAVSVLMVGKLLQNILQIRAGLTQNPGRTERKKFKFRRSLYQGLFTLFFSMLVVPIFNAYATLIDCTLADDGFWYMDVGGRLCYHGWHLAWAAVWSVLMFAYLPLCFLFESVHTELEQLPVIRLGRKEGCFYPFEGVVDKDGQARDCCWLLTTLRVVQVSFQAGCRTVTLPHHNMGTFTKTTFQATRRARVMMKVALPVVQVLQTTHVRSRLTAYFIMCLLNYLAHIIWPPFRDGSIEDLVELLQVIVLVGSSCTMWILWQQVRKEDADEALNRACYLFYFISGCLFVLFFVSQEIARRRANSSKDRSAKMMRFLETEPVCENPVMTGAQSMAQQKVRRPPHQRSRGNLNSGSKLMS